MACTDLKCRVRTVNTQPKYYDIYCTNCGEIQEVWDRMQEQLRAFCAVCGRETLHGYCANGGTGFRYRFLDHDTALGPKTDLGDDY